MAPTAPHTSAMSVVRFLAVLLLCVPSLVSAAPCAAFILRTNGAWQLCSNSPSTIPGSIAFPAGTVISGSNFVNGQIAQCVGKFPFPAPAGFQYASRQLFRTPNGRRCAGQFANFYEGYGPDGSFVVQCTN